MAYGCGMDVSLEQSRLRLVDGKGRHDWDAKVSSKQDALIAWFKGLDLPLDARLRPSCSRNLKICSRDHLWQAATIYQSQTFSRHYAT